MLAEKISDEGMSSMAMLKISGSGIVMAWRDDMRHGIISINGVMACVTKYNQKYQRHQQNIGSVSGINIDESNDDK